MPEGLPRRDSRSILKVSNSQIPHSASSAAFYSNEKKGLRARPHSLPPAVSFEKPAPASVKQAATTVSFEVRCETNWGDTVVVVGGVTALGEWDSARGIQLHTNGDSYPVWHGASDALTPCEWKLVILRAESDGTRTVEWEPMEGNRRLSFKDDNGSRHVHLVAAWGGACVLRWAPAPSMLASPHPGGLAEVPATPTVEQLIQQMPARGAAPRNSLHSMPPPTNSFSLPGALKTAEQPSHAALDRLIAAQARAPVAPGTALPPATPPPIPPVQLVPVHCHGEPLDIRVGDPLDAIESCDGSWPPSERSSNRSMASIRSQPASAHTSAVDLDSSAHGSQPPRSAAAAAAAAGVHVPVDLESLDLSASRALARPLAA